MEPLIDGKDLAEAIGVSPSAVSMAAKEERPCEGWPVHDWVHRGLNGTARGYAVPSGAREELDLPPVEQAAGARGRAPTPGAEGSAGSASEWFEEIAEEGLGDKGLGEEALEALTRRYLTVLAAGVAQRAYEEMGPWLKAAIRARLKAGEGPSDRREEGKGGETPERSSGEATEARDGFSVNITGPSGKFIESGLNEGAAEDGDATGNGDATDAEDVTGGTGRAEGDSGPEGDSRSEGGSGRE